MAKRKVAILGGGMAGLTAAWELTRTPELADENQVTIYQMGWRLGGKGASGRTADGRILEHGLHVWFGCYDNAFRMLKDVYAEWQPNPASPLRSWRDAVTPQDYALFGYDDQGVRRYHDLRFDGNSREPGSGDVTSSVWDLAVTLYQLVRGLLQREFADDASPADDPMPLPLVLSPSRRAAADAWSLSARIVDDAAVPRSLLRVNAIKSATHEAAQALRAAAGSDVRGRLLHEGMDLVGAILRGVLSDCYVGGRSLDALDDQELTAWLHRHGCELRVESSTLLRTMYDTFFWYAEGNPAAPSVGAGTGLTVILRAMCTYKQSITFKLNAGMGEVVVAPIYEVLKARGVKFKFFRRVERLELDAARTAIGRVHLSRQADTLPGQEYQPTIVVKGLTCWPGEPLWAQLQGGKRDVDFESHWDNTTAGPEVLDYDPDPNAHRDTFTHVVLAVSLGAYKTLNQDPGMCDELFQANPRFQSMAASMDLIPSQAAQLWSNRTVPDLSAYEPTYESVAGPQPQPIWADMSQVLALETHTGVPPLSVHYGCGTYDTQVHKQPRGTSPSPQRQANADVTAKLVTWLNQSSAGLWGNARANGGFDWNVLWDPQNGVGQARLGAQYVRANVSPTECCPGTGPGSSSRRLRSDETGFSNLFLAGCYVRTGLNTTCVEGAVMSGKQASRAICGFPQVVVGENFSSNLGFDDDVAVKLPAARALPNYVSQLGMGQMSHEAPLFVGQVQIHAFRLKGMRWRMQRLVDHNLNLPSVRAGSPIRFTVLGNSLLLAFLRSEAAGPTSPTNNVGKMNDREAAIFIPLLMRDGLQLKLTAWIPYLFIDRPIGMTMGREVWGYNKSAGVIHLPYDPQPSAHYVVNTTAIKTHAPNSIAEDLDILKLRRPLNPAPANPPSWTKLAQVLLTLVPEATLFKALIPRALPVVNLKQFRDIADSRLACYQALVESPMEPSGNISAGLIDTNGYKLDIATCDSHAIVNQLGLAEGPGRLSTTVDVMQGAWVKLDFTAVHGRVLWQYP